MDVCLPPVEESYRFCRKAARNAGSNFVWALWMLPANSRRAMHALYAFARRTDDLADEDSGKTPAQRLHELTQWRMALEAALAGEPTGPILPALADVVRTYAIPRQHLFDLIAGVTRDLSPPDYATFAELEEYCHLVASSVGLACLPIWGCREERAIAPAKACGLAFQLTNILRDLREDAALGRCYLPREDFAACGYRREDLQTGDNEPAFAELMRMQIERTRQAYDRAAPTEQYLEGGPRRLFRAMFGTYHGLFARIAAEPTQVLRGRLRVGWGRKLAIAAGAWWG
jgi:phytoene synthase